ncbi:MAG: fused MFS/spermidine synthase [Bacteroidales bacterium]|nr:fused MFS/spermidine synthase [Bacteroidales bacterium]
MFKKAFSKSINKTYKKNSSNIASKLIILIYFLSGICSLIDEVVWFRLLKLSIGNTVYASSIVVSVFMGGLALGSFIMSKYADNIKNRLRLYAILEFGATISAVLFPYALKLTDNAYQYFYSSFTSSPPILLFIQIVVSALLLLIPAMIMGSTLPLLGRYVTSLEERMGRLVGRLYALNMLGAALGCFLAGFVLIRVIGVMGTVYFAAIINLIVAIGGWILSLSHDFSTETSRSIHDIQIEKSEKTTKFNTSILLIAIFCSGLISIGYELIWMRSIVFLIGGTTYVFSAVLTIYLLGNVLGVWIGSRLSKILKYPVLAFGISLTLLGIVGVFYINFLNTWHSNLMPDFVAKTINFWENANVRTLFFPIFNSFSLFFIPAIIMGIGFPLALQAWGNYKHKVGKSTGIVYGINTIGAVLSGLIVGFIFIPLLGVQYSIIILGLIGIWIGSLMTVLFIIKNKILYRISYITIALGITIIVFLIPQDLFKRQFVTIAKKDTFPLIIKEGVNTTVSVHLGEDNELILATSGVQVAGDYEGFRITQKILGHLGVIINKNTQSALSVGFGSGESSKCLSDHDLKNIDVVEIAPELVDVSLEYFKHINLNEHIDEEVNVIYMDAKNYLHLTDKKYDLIVTDAINPKQIAENASLYTQEYFRSARKRLNPGGVLGCWLPISEIPISCTNSILGTFKEVFPYISMWLSVTAPNEYDFIFLVGSNDPQKYSIHHINSELNKNKVQSSVDYINFSNSHDVLNCYIGDQEGLSNYLDKYTINSDYNPYVEFNTDINEKKNIKKQWFRQFIEEIHQNNLVEKIDWNGISDKDIKEWLQVHELYNSISNILIQSRFINNPLVILQNCYTGLSVIPDNKSLLELEKYALGIIRDYLNTKPQNIDVILSNANVILKNQPSIGSLWLVRSWALILKKNYQEALQSAINAAKLNPKSSICQYYLGYLFLRLKQPENAIIYLNEAVKLDPDESLFHANLAIAYSNKGQYNKALLQLKQILTLSPYNYKVYCDMGNLYKIQGKLDKAKESYIKALQIKPDFELAKKNLQELTIQKPN